MAFTTSLQFILSNPPRGDPPRAYLIGVSLTLIGYTVAGTAYGAIKYLRDRNEQNKRNEKLSQNGVFSAPQIPLNVGYLATATVISAGVGAVVGVPAGVWWPVTVPLVGTIVTLYALTYVEIK